MILLRNGTATHNEAYLKDHLGNIRIAFHLANGSLKTRQVDSYYPFGMNIKGLTANSTDLTRPNEYLYNGKMMQDEMGLGWLDYGARFYDAVLGRWHSIDPVTKHPESPFAAFSNNPIRFVDPNGADTSFADNTARKEFNTVYNQTSNEISRLDKKIEKKAEKMQTDEAHSARYERQISRLNERRSDIYEVKNSLDAVISSETMFKFSALPNPDNKNLTGGGTHLNMDSKEVEISYYAGALGSLVHEARHGAGYAYGEWNQISNKQYVGYDYQDEYEAYRTENTYLIYFQESSIQKIYGNTIKDIILNNYSTKDYIIKEFNQICVP
jgi:RHS repeat-associated protein